MRCVCLPNHHPLVRESLPRITTIASESFKDIELSHLSERLQRYGHICLAFEKSELVGFLFISENIGPAFTLIGVRFSAVKSAWRRRGVTRRLVFAYARYWFPRYLASRVRHPGRRFLAFARVCSPQAYASFYIGQAVSPDLISGRPWSGQVAPQTVRALLRKELGFEALNLEDGQILSGATHAGLHPQNEQFDTSNWAVPWPEHVVPGSELIVFCEIGFHLFWRLFCNTFPRASHVK